MKGKRWHTVFHSSSSRLRIPDPKKHSLRTGSRISGDVPHCQESCSWDLHHLLLCVPPPEFVEAGIVYVFGVFRVHSDVLEHPAQNHKDKCISGQGRDHTLSIHRILRFNVVALCSSNSSANTSNMYPDSWHLRIRKMMSRFPGSFPFTLRNAHSSVSHYRNETDQKDAHLGTGIAPNLLASLAFT